MGITQLSRLLGMERSSFTRILDGIKSAGFVVLEETGNNRQKVYRLTNEGQNMLDKSVPIMVQLNNNLMKRLDNGFDVDKMFKAFEKLGVEDE
jgi:DNA-binding MarR family transcriptional regulator